MLYIITIDNFEYLFPILYSNFFPRLLFDDILRNIVV